MPLFSVVIPLYNKADTIERTLRSVAGQVFRDFEVVVVDDGSKDDGAAIVERFEGLPSLRVICQKNAGVSAARNKGVEEAGGGYIALLDADDEWLPYHLSDAAGVIKSNSDAVIVGCGYKWYGPKGVYSTASWCSGRKDMFASYAYYQPTHTSSIIIRRDAFLDVGGFDSRFSFYEDVQLFFRVAARFNRACYLIGRPSSIYHSDADVRLTSGDGTCHFMWDYPHLQYVEEQIASSSATRGMKKFMYCQLLRAEVDRYWVGDIDSNVKLVAAFPQSSRGVHRFFADSRCRFVKRFLARMIGLYYRLRFYTYVRRRRA